VLTNVQDAARRVIEEYHQLTLSVRDGDAFVIALLYPKPVNDRPRNTVRRYRERTVFDAWHKSVRPFEAQGSQMLRDLRAA